MWSELASSGLGCAGNDRTSITWKVRCEVDPGRRTPSCSVFFFQGLLITHPFDGELQLAAAQVHRILEVPFFSRGCTATESSFTIMLFPDNSNPPPVAEQQAVHARAVAHVEEVFTELLQRT